MPDQIEVLVIETGVANIASMLAALERLGARATLTKDAQAIQEAKAVVLPGVGAFGAGMARLHELGLVDAIKARHEQDLSTLCVCLGLQLLSQQSQESPGVEGIGILDTQVVHFTTQTLLIPQLGWNHVQPQEGCALLEPGYAYFANSYHLEQAPTGWSVAYSEHGERFVSAIERGRWLACQFHPELSGKWGLELMRRWLDRANMPQERG